MTYPVRPNHINAQRHLFGGFGNRETEISAGWVVRFCQQRGAGWQPFTEADINGFYHTNGQLGEFWFNGLVKGGFLVLKDGKYSFTHEFVLNCFRASPDV